VPILVFVRKLAAPALFLVFNCLPANAQTTTDAIKARLIGQPLLLRGFWLDDSLRFDSAGKPSETYKIGSFTQSAFDAKEVKLDGGRLTIEGQRVALTFTKDGAVERVPLTKPKHFGASSEKLTIVIDGQGDPDFGKELDAIFASHLYEITPSLPEIWQPFARTHFLRPGQLANPTNYRTKSTVMHVGANVMRPEVLKQIEPTFTETARQLNYSGESEIYLWVERDGTPSHITIVQPVGAGLDEKAAAAVAQYQFSPALFDDKPVIVDLYVKVNFQIR
jgi:hypothetical protein